MKGNLCLFRHDLPAIPSSSTMPDAAGPPISRDGTHHGLQYGERETLCGESEKGGEHPFAHSCISQTSIDCLRLDTGSAPTVSTRDSRWSIPCRYYLSGNCRNGDGCSYAHSKEIETRSSYQETNDLNVRSANGPSL
jgi:RNA-binding, Nab2-type zinc finger